MIIIDNYIKDVTFFNSIRCRETWEEYDRINKYEHTENTLIYDKDSKEKNILERFIESLLEDNYLQLSQYKYSKVEYWANCLSKDKPLDWHQDKDEVLLQKTGELVHPQVGIIWYAMIDEVVGGYLEIDHEDIARNYERIKPVENRLIVFNPVKFHRVSKIFSGTRYGLQINLW